MSSKPSYLITLATGRQGTSTAIELLKRGVTVHVFVRSASAPKALHLKSLGCIVFEGSADDPSTMAPAMRGVTGVFLNFFPDGRDFDKQISQAVNFLVAAQNAKTVTSVVVSTGLNTGKHQEWLEVNPNYPMKWYYMAKNGIEEAVSESDITYKTFLRPGWLMHNYVEETLYSTHWPRYREGIMDVAYEPGTKTAHFDPSDVGKFATAAFEHPAKFNGEVIELGNEQLTIEEVAATLSKGTGVKVEAHHCSKEEAAEWENRRVAGGLWMRGRWGDKEGMYTCDPTVLEKYGIELTTFEEFVAREKGNLRGAFEIAE
jgi:uncharacterized protein YbjT (DUF2867 family)